MLRLYKIFGHLQLSQSDRVDKMQNKTAISTFPRTFIDVHSHVTNVNFICSFVVLISSS